MSKSTKSDVAFSDFLRATLKARINATERQSLNAVAKDCGIPQQRLHAFVVKGAGLQMPHVDTLVRWLGISYGYAKRQKAVENILQKSLENS